MGAPEKDIDFDILYDLGDRGFTQKEQAESLGVSIPTLAKRIGEIQKNQGIIMQYRALQSLQLTELQAKILENITVEKIDAAPLHDLVVAFKILKDKELVVDGKPTEIKGLVAHLVHIEKMKAAGKEIPEAVEEVIIDAEFTEDGEEVPIL